MASGSYLQAVQTLPKALPLTQPPSSWTLRTPTWQVYIPQEVEAVAGYYQQKGNGIELEA